MSLVVKNSVAANEATPVLEQQTHRHSRDGEYNLPPADRGMRAWSTLFGCFCAFFAALSMMNSVGAYQNWILTHQLEGHSPVAVGWIFGLYNFLSFFMGLPIGPIFDVKGPKVLALCGAILLLLTYVLLAQCTEYWHFLMCFGFLGSLSTCLLFTSAVGTVQHWFIRRRGLATGLAICGGSVGGITTPLVLQTLLPRIGFPWSLRALALIMLLPLIIANALMKRRLEPEPSVKGPIILPDLRLLLHKQRFTLACGAFFIELGLFVPMTYIVSYVMYQGFSSTVAYHMVTLMNVGSLIGRLLPGWIGDKLGYFNCQILALAICLCSVLGLWLTAGFSIPRTTAFVVLFGIGSGSGISLVPVCIGQLCETEMYGRTFTAIYSISSFGSLFGVPLGGQLLKVSDGSYYGLIIFCGVSYFLASVAFIIVRILAVGCSPKVKF